MTNRAAQLTSARRLRHQPFALDQVTVAMRAEVACWSIGPDSRGEALRGIMRFLAAVPPGSGCTVQQWWEQLRPELFPRWFSDTSPNHSWV